MRRTSEHSSETRREEGVERGRFLSFEPGESPRDWPEWRKWMLLVPIFFVDFSVSWGASSFSPAQMKFTKDFGVSDEVGTLGLSLYVLGLSFGPMFLAPLSEYYGRTPIYVGSYFCFLSFMLGTALAPNLGAFLVFRILTGLLSSVTIANLGGSIADLWEPRYTGYAMSIFILAATGGSPTGYFLFSTVAQTRGWRDVFWALLGICGGFWIFVTATLLILGETRHDVLLSRKARRMQIQGVKDVELHPEHRRTGLKQLLAQTLTRPFRLLGTEPIIIFGALYNGFLYGISFLFNEALSLVFKQHDFTTIDVGLAFLGIFVGIAIGPLTNIIQERYFQKRFEQANGPVPEARVLMAMPAAVALPISLFWFAWTSLPAVHWVVPILAAVLWSWSFYTLILCTYTYTEDSYGMYSASALAGLGLVRNLAGAGFPLFGRQMYQRLGYEWASSLLGFLAVLLVPITFVLYLKGQYLRSRSPFALSVGEEEGTTYSQAEKKRGEL